MSQTTPTLEKLDSIPGCTLIADFLTGDEQQTLLRQIDEQDVWTNEIKRRVQQYGHLYSYKSKALTSEGAEPIPPFMDALAERLVKDGIFERKPDTIIVNEYLPGQGIAMHIDKDYCFDEIVVSISLGSVYAMKFEGPNGEKIEMDLPAGSLLLLKGDARYQWKHGIAARKSDHGRQRGRRVSITMRNTIEATTASAEGRSVPCKTANAIVEALSRGQGQVKNQCVGSIRGIPIQEIPELLCEGLRGLRWKGLKREDKGGFIHLYMWSINRWSESGGKNGFVVCRCCYYGVGWELSGLKLFVRRADAANAMIAAYHEDVINGLDENDLDRVFGSIAAV